MTQAILEIAGMLLGSLAIGIFFTYRYWKSKLDPIREENDSLQQENEKLATDSEELKKQLVDLKLKQEEEIKQLEKTHNKELKEAKSDSRAKAKELKEQKNEVKRLAATIKDLENELEIKDEQLGEKERELEEVTKHFTTHNISYYKQIDGKRYKAATLFEADESVDGRGDGRISKADAEKIFATISDGHTYTQVEKDTMHYIREHYNWTPEADELFRKKVRSWAAKGHQLS